MTDNSGKGHAGPSLWRANTTLAIFLLIAASSTCSLYGNDNSSNESQIDSKVANVTASRQLSPELIDDRPAGPYCGVNSLYVSLAALGINTEPKDYICKEYIGSYRGSTAAELIKAANAFGANAESFSHLTHRELKRAETPMILHMRADHQSNFTHWVAFLGYDGQKMRVVDPPRPLQVLTPAELLANWDGTAIAISRNKGNYGFLADARLDLAIAAGVLLFGTYAAWQFFGICFPGFACPRCIAPQKSLALQASTLVVFSLILSLFYHASAEIGFFRNPSALAEVVRRHYSIDIPEVSLAEMIDEIETGATLILDARRLSDFNNGPLPGAVSMAVDSTLPERQKVLTGIPKGRRIIVYCQSASCSYADTIAQFLHFNGYRNVAVYTGGFREWSQYQPTTQHFFLSSPAGDRGE